MSAARILAVDVTGDGCAVGVWAGGTVAAARDEPMRRGQAERLVPTAGEALTAAGLAWDELDAVAVTTGPGGFTGVRIGLAAARGWGLALGVPVYGVTTFTAVRAGVAAADHPVLVALDSKRADIYAQLLGADGTALTAPAALAPDALDAHLPGGALACVGSAADRAGEALTAAGRAVERLPGPDRPDPAALARLAATGRGLVEPGPPRPLYLRPPDTTPPKRA